MDTLTFISNLIQSLTWPIVVLAIILIFKSEITEIFAVLNRKLVSLIKAKHKDSEVLFEVEKASSILEKATADKPKAKGETVKKDILNEIFIRRLEMGLSACCIASLLIPVCPLPGYVLKRMHKSIKSALEEMLELVKEKYPDSLNMAYYEEILSLHTSQKFEE